MEQPLRICRRIDRDYQMTSLRIPKDLYQKIEEIAAKTNRSRNAIVNLILEYGVQNIEILPK